MVCQQASSKCFPQRPIASDDFQAILNELGWGCWMTCQGRGKHYDIVSSDSSPEHELADILLIEQADLRTCWASAESFQFELGECF